MLINDLWGYANMYPQALKIEIAPLVDDERTVNTGGEIHSILPPLAAKILKSAAATPLDEGAADPGFNRRKAIDRANAHVKELWPRFFRE